MTPYVAAEAAIAPDAVSSKAPPVPETLEDTGLSSAFVSDLLLKTL